MTTDRMNYLLLEAAKCFEEERDPFDDMWWAIRNKISLNELAELSRLIGQIIAGYARADEETRDYISVLGVAGESISRDSLKIATRLVHNALR